MPSPVPRRGVIEGFYGRPWTFAERVDALRFLADVGMNAYVYAPKDDPKHRAAWREPYDAGEMEAFRNLAAVGREVGVDVGFALSPGLDLDPTDPDDRRALDAKVGAVMDFGISWIVLAFDDIEAGPNGGATQASVANELLAGMRGRDAAAELVVVPTEYVGSRPSPYLAALGDDLDPSIGLMWTGPTVCSPTISGADAAIRAARVGGRAPLVWDNVPVNDGLMASSLHLGPYRGRDGELATSVSGILLNPMNQALCSRIAIATAAEYLASPTRYDSDAAWVRAIERVDGGRGWLAPIARALADSPVNPPSSIPASALLDAHDWDALRAEVRALRDAGRRVEAAATDDPLAAEIAPWCDAIARETDAAGAALRLIRRLDDGPVDAAGAMADAIGVAWAWSAAATRSDHAVLGPRAAVHPAVVQLPDGRPAFDVGLGLRFGLNVVDRLCRHALDAYEAWRTAQEVDA